MEIPDSNTLRHNHRWWQIYVQPVWDVSYRDHDYVYEPFNDSVTKQQWLDYGFEPQRFTGEMYDMRFEAPHWLASMKLPIQINNVGWSLYRMSPGAILPEHRDTYRRYREKFKIFDLDSIVRCVIFLEDWQSGHYFEIDNSPIVGWTKGQGICWIGDTVHLAANIGKTDRYTLQITGSFA
jgi:hypothetical protein